jgi:hypothetical protein
MSYRTWQFSSVRWWVDCCLALSDGTEARQLLLTLRMVCCEATLALAAYLAVLFSFTFKI